MTKVFRATYRFWVSILFVAVVVQIGAAGFGAFYADSKVGGDAGSVSQKQFDHGFGVHIALGYIIFLASLLLFLLALAARLGRKGVLLTLVLPLLVFVQIVLARVGANTPGVGALHPVNAVAILGLVGYLAHWAWAKHRAGKATVPATSTAA